jgi:hypothetical protein
MLPYGWHWPTRCGFEGNCPCILLRKSIGCMCSISRCAFLNAPAGSFPKTSDKLNPKLRDVTRMYFGEENADRYC